jgi:hypothetical protein
VFKSLTSDCFIPRASANYNRKSLQFSLTASNNCSGVGEASGSLQDTIKLQSYNPSMNWSIWTNMGYAQIDRR